ncbi:MAG: Predicted cobalt transporter CbtA, partial [uncultured Rubrobacteraceae bacterium]
DPNPPPMGAPRGPRRRPARRALRLRLRGADPRPCHRDGGQRRPQPRRGAGGRLPPRRGGGLRAWRAEGRAVPGDRALRHRYGGALRPRLGALRGAPGGRGLGPEHQAGGRGLRGGGPRAVPEVPPEPARRRYGPGDPYRPHPLVPRDGRPLPARRLLRVAALPGARGALDARAPPRDRLVSRRLVGVAHVPAARLRGGHGRGCPGGSRVGLQALFPGYAGRALGGGRVRLRAALGEGSCTRREGDGALRARGDHGV